MYEVKTTENASATTTATEEPQACNLFNAIAHTKGPVLGVALTIPSTFVAQLLGLTQSGFVLIDMEHSPISPELMTDMVHAIVSSSRGSCLPIVRVPSQGVEWIKWALDSGAAGIVIPMVSSKVDMERIIEHSLFPPNGKRSFGPARSPWGLPNGPQGGISSCFRRALDQELAILPMIESKEGLQNIEEIISVKGVSGVFIGPMDLRLSLGLSGMDGPEQAFTDALARIIDTTRKSGKIVGTLGLDSSVLKERKLGSMDFLVVSVDAGAMSSMVTQDLTRSRQATILQPHSSL